MKIPTPQQRSDPSFLAHSLQPAMRARFFKPIMFEIDTWQQSWGANPETRCESWIKNKHFWGLGAGAGSFLEDVKGPLDVNVVPLQLHPGAPHRLSCDACVWKSFGWQHCAGTCRKYCPREMDHDLSRAVFPSRARGEEL